MSGFLRVCPVVLLTLFSPLALQAEVTKDASGRPVLESRDASGRVLSRIVLEADGSRHVTSTEYWPESQVARRTVDENADGTGRVTKRVTQEFDEGGRLQERKDVAVDAAGKQQGTRTRYSYDAKGARTETTLPLER